MIALVVCLIGIALCLYGMHVQHRVRVNPNYKASCDLSDRVSCTQTFRSQYGAILGISNITVGLIFYSAMVLLVMLNAMTLFKIGAVGAVLASAYLAYLQYGKLRIVCLLCTSLYIVNAALAWIAFH